MSRTPGWPSLISILGNWAAGCAAGAAGAGAAVGWAAGVLLQAASSMDRDPTTATTPRTTVDRLNIPVGSQLRVLLGDWKSVWRVERFRVWSRDPGFRPVGSGPESYIGLPPWRRAAFVWREFARGRWLTLVVVEKSGVVSGTAPAGAMQARLYQVQHVSQQACCACGLGFLY